MPKILRTFVIDTALVAGVILIWRNPEAGAEAAGHALEWVDSHLRPLVEGSTPEP